MEDAPLFDDVAEGPDNGRGIWLTAADGLRLRIGYWPGGDKGTVLLFPGRTEYVEKYGHSARDLTARGYSCLAIDWRGQGLADRLLDDPAKGHVTRFLDYQLDVDAVIAALPYLGIAQERLFLVAHSMGGCIGLRSLLNGLPVRAAAFSAPMWGLPGQSVGQYIAHALVAAGFGKAYAPGSGGATSYAATTPFDENTLTSDPGMLDYMQRQTTAHPDLALGAPTIRWASEAFREMRDLSRQTLPDLPAVTFMGADEAIVSNPAISAQMTRWQGGELIEVPDGRHEVMMETRPVQEQFFDKVCTLFDGA